MSDYLVKYSIWKKLYDRYLLHFYLEPFCKRRSQLPESEILKNIFVFAQHRGGSTWLTEILSTIPKSRPIIEPLWRGRMSTNGQMPHPNIGRCDQIKNHRLNFYFQQPIPENSEWPEAEQFFKELFKLEISKLGLYADLDIRKISRTETFIFKFCFGNQLMPWLVEKLKIRPLLLVRHPCAVVHSQLHVPYWSQIRDLPKFRIANFRFNELYRHYADILNDIRTTEENLAAHWCLNMVGSIKNENNNRKWLTVSYENLYENFEFEVNRIFKWLDRPIPEGIKKFNYKPSQWTEDYSNSYIESGNQLNLWKEKLSCDQISRILGIVEKFDIPGYTNSIRPNIDILYQH
ncbi:MAG: sulfotransferase domain-containing protein [Bacteroidetes bacterium]|nr:sulfotransferase domain-containing protein [Bacteroidota bacterium]MDA1119915.1 sulfotransferase domain-containing protein [Bacteroidota bacterium]